MVLTCVPELSLTPVAVATELAVGLLDVTPVEDEFDVDLGEKVTPFIMASVAMASPILIQSSYEQLDQFSLVFFGNFINKCTYQYEVGVSLVQAYTKIRLSLD